MILIDTSVWIDLLRGNGRGPELASMLRSDEPLASTEPVLMELLAGTRNEGEYASVRRLGTSVGWLPLDPATDFDSSAQIYAHCRRNGVTPRGLVDTLIAAIALRTECALMTSDRGFAAMETLVPLELV
ncbi:MAG: PIN domain-containing protein [Candidatus Nanopelagicales bacterium]|nr:PIN domain-containing protein [Candidatus Nanopelagicales bacterium]MCF8539683.1 PIN domain-containing protein [Candidatus Nanopelagicales bacterium]MCF8550866.1 PIN domain-containing protein [Candidatus Nanopelagicales bacterium]